MELFKEGTTKSAQIPKKRSLIAILYFFPIVFFISGLTTIFAYYTWFQIHKYNIQIAELKKVYPEHQKAELKSKVLMLKDYIQWVKSHPAEELTALISNRLEATEALIQYYHGQDSNTLDHFSIALTDSLDKLNKATIYKLFFLNDNDEVVYPVNPIDEKSNSISKLSKNYLIIENKENLRKIISDLTNHKVATGSYILIKRLNRKNLRIGINFQNSSINSGLQEVVLDSLSKIKYPNNEYVIINTYDGLALLSKGKRQFPPLKISNSIESNWKDIFAKELEYARLPQGGFYTYFWRNNTNVERSEKTSFFSGINDWEWIIGTGFFTNDVEPVINRMNAELKIDIRNNLIKFFVFLIILTVVGYFSMRYFALKAKSNIDLFLNFFKRAAKGMQLIDTSKLAFTEFDTIAQAANQMIHERERIKSVLSAEKSRLKYMIDAIPDLIFFKDADSKFLGCNKAFENYINKKSDDILGLSEFDLFGRLEAETYIKSDMKIINSLQPERTTNWIEYQNGQRMLFYTLKTPYFDSENNLLGIIGISRDITEMEETRQRLILAKEKAEESDRLKTAFLANMSHEIRTPMNAIIGFSDLLAEDDLTTEDKKDYISKIKSAGHALMSLINDIIDIAKIEAGQLKVSESMCNIDHILNDLLGTFIELKNTSGKRNINLNLVRPEKSNETIVISDPMRLQQILTNLLSNALKFTEFGQVEFGYSIDGNFLSFYVKDTGIGILRSKQKLLFQRFSQLDPSTTRKYGGTGLGLAISKNLIDLMGGTIDLESTPGKGSMFYFTIPYKPVVSKPAKPSKQDLNNINWKGKTILIAEDILQNFLLMEALLKKSEAELIHALNGQIAIDIVRSNPYIDLVLMDIQLPIKTGYEALREILEIRPELPILSYTAFALPHEREKSMTAGFVDFIPKPIKAEILIPMLDKYLQNQD